MDILESVYWFHSISQICNLTQAVVTTKNWTVRKSYVQMCYNLVIIVISLILLFYGLFATTGEYFQNNANKIGQTVDYIQLVGIRVAHIVALIEAMVRRKDVQRFFEKVREIDGIFENSLNTEVDNRQVLLWICFLYIFVLSYLKTPNYNFMLQPFTNLQKISQPNRSTRLHCTRLICRHRAFYFNYKTSKRSIHSLLDFLYDALNSLRFPLLSN